MSLTRIFTRRTTLMALAVGVIASLTVALFTSFGAKAELMNSKSGKLHHHKVDLSPSIAGFTESLPVQKPPASGCGASFTQPAGSPVSAGNAPDSVAVGDFNLDGKPDLAVANSISDNVTILLGKGNGDFAPAAGSPVGAGNYPSSVVEGDFNLDGKPDLAVANSGNGNVTILLGNGTGGFTQATGSPVIAGDFIQSVAVGDFNLDGRPDLVVANYLSDNVAILLGNGLGGFTQAAGSPVSAGNGPSSVTVKDFNLDGKSDLAVANNGSDNVTILLGNGMGGFTQTTGSPVSAGSRPRSVVAGDFNLDGKPDLAVANNGSSNVTILLGNGMGGFTQAMDSPVNARRRPVSASVGDFNLDGKSDLAVANAGFSSVSILLGNGNGGFAQPTGSPVPVGTGPEAVAVGDFNLDGKPDFATGNYGSDDVTIQLNTCDAHPCGGLAFSQPVGSPITVGDGPRAIAVEDFNLDGKLDLAVPNATIKDSSGVTILLGTGGGGFTQAAGSPVASSFPEDIAVGDFNRDGKPDLAVVNSYESHNVAILLGNGSGGFSQAGSPIAVGLFPSSVAVGDLNLDGKSDLAVVNSFSGNVTILLGNGTGGFTQPADSPVRAGGSPFDVAAEDFNLDGKLDLAVANRGSDDVTILWGNGSGSFPQTTDVMIGARSTPFSIVTADFNRDGKPDFAVVNQTSANVSVLLGNGSGLFTAITSLTAGVGILPRSVEVGDFNLDGKPDVAISSYSSSNVVIFRGDEAGSFRPPNFLPYGLPINLGTVASILSVGDFNRDGKSDFAALTFDDQTRTSKVMSQINTCSPNVLPTISAMPVTRSANGISTYSQIATVTEAEDTLTTLRVRVNGGFSATINGVTVYDPYVNAAGEVIASVTAGCGATNASFILRVSDSVDAFAEATLNVTVTPDTPPPSIVCPADISVGTTGTTANVMYAAPAVSDNCPSVQVPICTRASVSGFPLGQTTINCSVKDATDNMALCSFAVTVNKISFDIADPLTCIGPGNVVTGNFTVTNNATAATSVSAKVTLPAGLLVLLGTSSASAGTVSVDSASMVSYTNAALAPGQTVTVNYQAQVGEQVIAGTTLTSNLAVQFGAGPVTTVLASMVINCQQAGPGMLPQFVSPLSDGRPGSVLMYNVYTSAATGGEAQNTRIAITNTHLQQAAFVHLFFVAESCSVADSFLCLTPNQTATFLASDLDPGTSGYIVAVATDPRGCPANFNFLIGDEFVKLASGHATNLGAEAIAAIAGGLPVCDSNSVTAQLSFDGLSYAPVPRALALSNLASRADGNDTLLVLNRIGGNLGIGASTLGSIFGILYDDAEHGLSFSFSGNCQLRSSINNNFPRTAPRFEQFVPAGRSGWMRLYSQSDVGITGAAINFNANAASTAGAFNQGHNLHTLTLATAASYVIPVFPPNC